MGNRNYSPFSEFLFCYHQLQVLLREYTLNSGEYILYHYQKPNKEQLRSPFAEWWGKKKRPF